jgi:hypothetical protein
MMYAALSSAFADFVRNKKPEMQDAAISTAAELLLDRRRSSSLYDSVAAMRFSAMSSDIFMKAYQEDGRVAESYLEFRELMGEFKALCGFLRDLDDGEAGHFLFFLADLHDQLTCRSKFQKHVSKGLRVRCESIPALERGEEIFFFFYRKDTPLNLIFNILRSYFPRFEYAVPSCGKIYASCFDGSTNVIASISFELEARYVVVDVRKINNC